MILRSGRAAVCAAVLAVVAQMFFPAPVAAAPRAGSADAPLGTADRVLIFSVPTLAWSDLDDVDAPNLSGLLAESVVADLSVRSVTRSTNANDGYATLNAGTRTEGTAPSSLAFVAGLRREGDSDSDVDGDPLDVPPGAFEVNPDEEPTGVVPPPAPEPIDPATIPPEAGETYDGSPAAEEFARRTGVLPQVGQVFNFGLVSMLRLNERLLFGSEVGALGNSLADAGVRRAVIANGDHGEGSDDVDFRREASVGLMDGDGLVDRGRVGRTLLQDSARSPFGVRYDNPEVAAAFREFWKPRSVVLVEASDMVRVEDAKALSTPAQQIRLRRAAIERSDELLGRLLEDVDLDRDAVLVVAPYASGATTALTVAAVRAPEVEPGLLSSGTTRRGGFVQTVDVAPTILSLMGVEPNPSMEGTPMERRGSGGDFAERREFMVQADLAAKFRDSGTGLASTIFVLVQIVLWGLALFVLARGTRRLRSITEVAALAVLWFLPMTFVAGMLPFHRWVTAGIWLFLVAASGALAAVTYLLTRSGLVDPLIVTLAGIVAILSVDIIIGGPLQFNTLFGYTPTVAGRFAGMGNLAFSMFVSAAIILACLIAHRIGGRRGAWMGIAVLVWAFLVDALPFWGADVGGGLSFLPAAAVTAWMLLGLRIRIRSALLWAAASVVVVTALGIVDMLRPPAERSHLGRLLADIGDNGFSAFETVVLRKIDANLSVLSSSVWTLMVPLVFIFLGYLYWRAPWRLRMIAEQIPEERAAVVGLLTAMVLGFALNDSGISIPGVMIGVANASLIHLLLRVDAIDVQERAAASPTPADEAESVVAAAAS